MVYGVKPCFILDTLSMARALRGVEVGNSLMKLAEDFGLPPKGRAVHSTDGLDELTPEIAHELAEYCKHDVYLCERIYGFLALRIDPVTRLSAGPYPTKELRLIDMTVRMYTDPVLELDKAMLVEALGEEKEKLEAALVKADVEESALASNDHFADVLRKLGCEPPTKKSKITGKEAYAFAKNDALFQAMLNGDDEDVALLCEARLKVKSTLERTRAQRFIDIADRGSLPVPLSYYGAAVTGRWSAAKGSNINLQNMKRGSFLRKSIMAPAGHLLCVGDLSQIEPRVLAWLSDYEAMLNIFKAGGDPYATFGSQMFSIPGLTKDSHPLLRQSAKSALLGAGYQLGWASFAAQLLTGFLGAPPVCYTKRDCKQLGVTAQDAHKFMSYHDNVEKMNEIPHTCTEEALLFHCLASKAIIDKYRAAASPVVDFWELLGTLMQTCLVGGDTYEHKGVLQFRKNEIELVSGMCIRYPDLKAHVDDKDEKKRVIYTYDNGKSRTKLYPGKICNNVTQATARCVMSDGLLRVQKRYFVAGTVHDEGIFVIPKEDKETALPWVLGEMTKTPKWMPGIPLNADGGVHRRYGLAKN
jgi:DNA polymerase